MQEKTIENKNTVKKIDSILRLIFVTRTNLFYDTIENYADTIDKLADKNTPNRNDLLDIFNQIYTLPNEFFDEYLNGYDFDNILEILKLEYAWHIVKFEDTTRFLPKDIETARFLYEEFINIKKIS